MNEIKNTRERDYYSEEKRTALIGPGYVFAAISLVISVSGALISFYTISSMP
jgi:hypothetical protein